MKEFFENLLFLIFVAICVIAPLVICCLIANAVINSDLPLFWKWLILR